MTRRLLLLIVLASAPGCERQPAQAPAVEPAPTAAVPAPAAAEPAPTAVKPTPTAVVAEDVPKAQTDREGSDQKPGDATAAAKLRSGTAAEKGQVLEGFRETSDPTLIPAVIESILDDTSYPRQGDTGWGRVYHHAATALCQYAQKRDGKSQKQRGRKAYSFHDDGGVASEERRLEVHQNWVKWWSENKAEILK